MDRVICSPQSGSAGSGSGSERAICLDCNNKDLSLLSPIPSLASLRLNVPSRPVTPSPLRIVQPPRTPTLALSPTTATAELPGSPFLSLLFQLEDIMQHPRPTHSSATPSRPPSRSERHLRDTLHRDQERPPMPSSPPSQARSPRHKRRHSEVPGMMTREEEAQVEMMRGAMLFRSPAAPQPPSLERRHSHSQHNQASQASVSPTRSPILARRTSIKSNPRAPSPSSSHISRGISRSRVPHPLPLDSHHHRHASEQAMSPHEQALRARLERVLQTSKVTASPRRDVFYELDGNSPESPHSPAADDEHSNSNSYSSDQEDDSDENAVLDENGGRAWRGRPGARAMAASPPSSTSSGGSSARSESQDRLRLQSRSRTEPVLPAMHNHLPSSPYPAHPSPRRSSTAPNAAALKGHAQSPRYSQQSSSSHRHARPHHPRSGTTPPLVSDGSPTPPEEEDDSDDIEDMRLLTPPASPYHHHAHAHHQHHTMGYGYMPSPYMQKQQLHQPRSVPEDDEDDFSNPESEYNEEESDECSSGSCTGSNSCSCARRRAYLAQQRQAALSQLPTSPALHPGNRISQQQHQFNVRRASAKCREMEGYVSFAAVEGLGVPPDAESSEDEKMKRGHGGGGKKEGGVGGWVRRLWGSEGQGQVVV